MKTGEIAKRLGVGASTIRYWADEYREFLTDGATGRSSGAPRIFNEADQILIATVADLRAQGLTPAQISEALRGGRRVEKLPDVPSPAEVEARESVALVARPEYDRILDRVSTLSEELEAARAERDRAITTWQTDTSRLNQHINNLERELGEARGKLETLERLLNERRPADYWVRLLIIAIIGMLIIVALAVVFLAGRGG